MLEEKKTKSWCKSVSAFANRNGGVLIFGVSDNDNFTLILPNLNYKTTASSRKNVGENVGKNVGENLNKREKEILSLISANPTITQEEIAKTLNIAVRIVERNIKGLRDKIK